jgi:phosphate transport system permease protein
LFQPRSIAIFFRVLVTVLALTATGLIVLFFLFLLKESLPVFQAEGVGFLTGRDWWAGESYGAWPMIFGSAIVTLLALGLALPFALAGAVVASEFLSTRLRWWAKSLMELFAGVPGIVYGLLGVGVLAPAVEEFFGLIDGNTLFTAALLLGIMVLPTLLTLADDALHAVPGKFRDQAQSLGLSRLRTVWAVVLPQAKAGLLGAVFLGLGRAMGETIAVMLVIGGRDRLPAPWYNLFQSGQSIPSKLGREAAEAVGAGLQWNALMGLGLVLFLMVLGMTVAGHLFLKRGRAA